MTEQTTPLLLRARDIGILLGFSQRKVWAMLSSGQLPPSFRLGGSRVWRKTDIDQWIAAGFPRLEEFISLKGGRQ